MNYSKQILKISNPNIAILEAFTLINSLLLILHRVHQVHLCKYES